MDQPHEKVIAALGAGLLVLGIHDQFFSGTSADNQGVYRYTLWTPSSVPLSAPWSIFFGLAMLAYALHVDPLIDFKK